MRAAWEDGWFFSFLRCSAEALLSFNLFPFFRIYGVLGDLEAGNDVAYHFVLVFFFLSRSTCLFAPAFGPNASA